MAGKQRVEVEDHRAGISTKSRSRSRSRSSMMQGGFEPLAASRRKRRRIVKLSKTDNEKWMVARRSEVVMGTILGGRADNGKTGRTKTGEVTASRDSLESHHLT